MIYRNPFHPKGRPFENYPPSELQMRLYANGGMIYNHLVICSGDRRKPIGTPGCCCARIIKQSLSESS